MSVISLATLLDRSTSLNLPASDSDSASDSRETLGGNELVVVAAFVRLMGSRLGRL